MSDGSGILGVIVGAMLVIFVAAAVLVGTGKMGGGGQTFTIKLPDAR